MTAEGFAQAVGETMDRRITLLKIQCMNLYEIEEQCRMDRLIAFKCTYGQVLRTIDQCLCTYFPRIDEKERLQFRYSFFSFMYGMYPYVFPTKRQQEAMTRAGIMFQEVTISRLAYDCIRKLLGARQ